MIPTVGKKCRKLLVYSQASVRKVSEPPTRILPPMAGRIPPTEMVGSVSAASRMEEIMEVVVVFPWVPGYGDGLFIIPHELTQKLGPGQHGKITHLGPCKLRIVRVNGGRVDHHGAIVRNVLCLLSDADAGAQLFQVLRQLGRVTVRSGYGEALF